MYYWHYNSIEMGRQETKANPASASE